MYGIDFDVVWVRGKVKIADTGNHMDQLYRAIVIEKNDDQTKVFIPEFAETLWVGNWYIGY